MAAGGEAVDDKIEFGAKLLAHLERSARGRLSAPIGTGGNNGRLQAVTDGPNEWMVGNPDSDGRINAVYPGWTKFARRYQPGGWLLTRQTN